MKTRLLLSTFIWLCCHTGFAQMYLQYFDGADTSASNAIIIQLEADSSNVWQIGQPGKIIFDSAATQPNAIVTDTLNFYPPNDTSRFEIKIYTGSMFWGIFAMQWKQKLDFDPGTDGGIIEYSFDGATWENVFNNPYTYNFYGFQPSNQDTLAGGEFAFSGTDSTWRDIWLCFDYSWMWMMGDTIRLRFTMQSDSVNNNREGWMIDNMMAHITWVHTVGEAKKDKYFNVYPNPGNDMVHIDIKKIQEFHIIEKMELINASGQVVETWTNIPTRFFIDTRKYNNGLYNLRIRTNKERESIPLVINHP